jgi:hypothetical protein
MTKEQLFYPPLCLRQRNISLQTEFFDFVFLFFIYYFLFSFFEPRYLNIPSVVTGGDTASWQAIAHHFAHDLLPQFRFSGWDMGNFAGYPNFAYYFVFPFLLAVVPARLFHLPLAITLKWAIMSGIYLMPLFTYLGIRLMRFRFPAPILCAYAALLFMFNEKYNMFGGNTLSTFAGEFCYMFAFSLLPLFMGMLYNGLQKNRFLIANAVLLAIIGLSHTFVFIPAGLVVMYWFFTGHRPLYLIRLSLIAFGLMAFWLLPMLVYRHPYTTPITMIWYDFLDFDHIAAGLALILTVILPSLYQYRLIFRLCCAVLFALLVYLAFDYYLFAAKMWNTGLNSPTIFDARMPWKQAEKILPFRYWLPLIVLGLSTLLFLPGIRFFLKTQNSKLKTQNLKLTPQHFTPSALWMFVFLVSGCLVFYCTATFLQVPDIRFLPPVLLMLLFICSTRDLPLVFNLQNVRGYLGLALVCLGCLFFIWHNSPKSRQWYRVNNLGYERLRGFPVFNAINQYLRTCYPDPFNAPRVGYEKCYLYADYGGDRAFESLPFFAGRQTLEGIHYASAIGAKFISFLQTEFSKEQMVPSNYILSAMNKDALPVHLRLYNVSQLLVRTDKARNMLKHSSFFKLEKQIGPFEIYRLKNSQDAYVEVLLPEHLYLYTGKVAWKRFFYRWFKFVNLNNVFLVPAEYVSQAGKKMFAGVISRWEELQSASSSLKQDCFASFKVKTHLFQDRIEFETQAIGRPHLIKVSYYPNWQIVQGADQIYPVSPHFMLVFPQARKVVLAWKRTVWDMAGITITWLTVLVCAIMLIWDRPENKEINWLEQRLKPYLRKTGIALGLLAVIISCAGLYYRARPTRAFITAYHSLRTANQLKAQKQDKLAAKYYRQMIDVCNPVVNARDKWDNQDVISCILLTGDAYKNLGQKQKALQYYEIVVQEYPYSRYIKNVIQRLLQ